MYRNLKAEMARQDLSICALAELIHMSMQKLSRRLKGEVPFTVDEAIDIREKMKLQHMPIEVLFKRED